MCDDAFVDQIGLEVSDPDAPGIRRVRRGKGFSYVDARGRALTGRSRDRCEDLIIPPAWTDVWIAPSPNGHLQAVGLDDAGRKQYRYHDRWTEGRRLANFDRMLQVGAGLSRVRQQVERDLRSRSQERAMLAALVRLIDRSLGRIGNDASVRAMETFGISTLCWEHITVDHNEIALEFVGKGGVEHHIEVDDARLARVLASLEDQPHESVFTITRDLGPSRLTAEDANTYLARSSRGTVTCKDFRTWGASAIALEARADGADEVEAVDAAAEVLGNTRAVARSAYVHPDVLMAPVERVEQLWHGARRSTRCSRAERALLRLLDGSEPLLGRWLNQHELLAA